MHRRIHQPQTRRLHEFPTHESQVVHRNHLQHKSPVRESLLPAPFDRVLGGEGGGSAKEADEDAGDGNTGAGGFEVCVEAVQAIWEARDAGAGEGSSSEMMQS